MKLITEHTDEVDILIESSEDGKQKNHYITGIFMQSELQNRNGRIYPKKVLENQVTEYNKLIAEKRAMSELGHPDTPAINLDKVSHLITELSMKGNEAYGKAKILDTPNGRIAKTLLDEGCKLGVSSRGLGTLRESNGKRFVNNDFKLTAIDIVFDPSAPEAFVNGIMESKEYYFKNGILVEKEYVEIQQEVKSLTRTQLDEGALEKIFTRVLETLKKQ